MFGELLQHITIAYPGTHKLHAPLFQSHFHRHVGHECAHHTWDHFVIRQTVVRHQIQQFVTVVQTALRVHHLQSVRIAIERNAKVSLVGFDSTHQRIGMRGTHFVVDVQAIGAAANGNHLGTQLMKHLRRNVIRGTVRSVHHNLQAFEGEIVRERAFAKLDVAACSIVQAFGFAKVG